MMKTTDEISILWLTAGLGCDGETIALTGATQPSLEDILAGAVPGIPKVNFRNPLLAYESADDFMRHFHEAAAGEAGDFILVVEGSVPDETNKTEGFWAAFGVDENGEPILTVDWIEKLAPRAWAVVAAGTCASYGGVHAMQNNPTGAMGLADYLGWDWRSRAGVPIVCIPGCPTMPDTLTQTLVYLLQQFAGAMPMIDLDDSLRPRWIFEATLHEGCDRGGYYEQAQFAEDYGDRECIVKLGCWGPVVNCNVGKRGWTNGVGGCANVGGTCIGCTMPAFPEKFMSFMSQPPGSLLSSQAIATYGKAINSLRRYTLNSMNQTPAWRKKTAPFYQIEPLTKKDE
ncbi:MAG: hydrogenase expression protein HypE [Acidobacteria bacterium]|nr:hydrogenase expression protein HypE [Acidobacteriota bacterium]